MESCKIWIKAVLVLISNGEVTNMLPYTIEEISARVAPVAKKYGLASVYLFGSYARGEADANSDVDLLVDVSGTEIDTLLKLGGLYNDLEEALKGCGAKVITIGDATGAANILKAVAEGYAAANSI